MGIFALHQKTKKDNSGLKITFCSCQIQFMEIYKNNSNWKILLAGMGSIIVIITMIYSQFLANDLAQRELNTVQLYSDALRSVIESGEESTIMESLVLEQLGTIPIIMEAENGDLQGTNYGDQKDMDAEFLESRKASIIDKGYEPIKGPGGYASWIYYENSRTFNLISLFPIAQILLLSTFVIFGYYVFSTARKAEQNRVWAGMAKETAHQLGTPVSAIIGWIEHLKEISSDKPDHLEVVHELRNDVNRLELIADRFSKIGSKPELVKKDLVEELQLCIKYMQKRAPRRINFNFINPSGGAIFGKINSHLFDWVVENLLRNSLDAMEGVGDISINIELKGETVEIELSDSGKGIPGADHKKVFKPGFTTKKRGWGLGLSLAKRIIEDYHQGKIFVKTSKPNEGTTFAIQIPQA